VRKSARTAAAASLLGKRGARTSRLLRACAAGSHGKPAHLRQQPPAHPRGRPDRPAPLQLAA